MTDSSLGSRWVMSGRRGTTFLVGQAMLFAFYVLAGVAVATQQVARNLGYPEQFGSPFATLFGAPVYNPLCFPIWLYQYYSYSPAVFSRGWWPILVSILVAVTSTVCFSLWRARHESSHAHGSARWGRSYQLDRSGLLAATGIILGRSDTNRFLRHDGPEHVVLSAPTRSGKGVGLVIPTLLTWPASVIVTDMKAENWSRTAGFRSTFSHCVYFNPTDPSSSAYNPLHDVRRGPYEVRDAQNIADILVDPDGDGRRDHWTETAHTLLVGTILHVLYAESRKSLRGVLEALTDTRSTDVEVFESMRTTAHDPQGPSRGWHDPQTNQPSQTHPVVAAAAQMMLNKSPNERSGVLSTATRFLSLYLDEIVAANTDRSDFHALDLVEADKPVSLYLVIPPSDLSRTRSLFRLVLNLISRRLTESLTPPGQRHRLLMLLDEFPAYGRLEFFESNLAFLAGYGIKCVLVIQSPNQLERYYGRDHSILDNAHVRIFFTPNDPDTAELISRMLGQSTFLQRNRNYGGHRLALWLGHEMVMEQETARPLMTPGEVSVLPDDECLIFVGGQYPQRVKKIRYYEDPFFVKRVMEPPELVPGRYLHGPPTRPSGWHAVCATGSSLAADATSDDDGLDVSTRLDNEVSDTVESELDAESSSSVTVDSEENHSQRVARALELEPGRGGHSF